SLPAWSEDELFSHTYNMVHVRPRSRSGRGGDPSAMASRVFAVLRETALGDNDYYNTQAELAFTRVCQLLHGIVDAQGAGLVFNLRDVAVCLKGIGDD